MTDEYPPFTLLMVCPDHVVRPLSGSTLISEYEKLTTEIKRLEDALVEERAKDDAKLPELCDIVHDELMCTALEGDCEHWDGCPRKDEMRKAARKQLRAEGVIG